jgi:hypothetical protein
MDLKWIAVMVVGFIAAMVGMNKQKAGVAWGQILAILGAIVAVGGAAMNLTGFFQEGSKQMAREQRYMYVQAKFLAEAVKKEAPSAQKVAVICDSYLYIDGYGDPLPKAGDSPYIEAIKDTFKGAEIVPVYIKYKVKKPAGADSKNVMPPVMPGMMSSGQFKQIVSDIKKAKCDVVINITQFPMDCKLPASLGLLKGTKIGFFAFCTADELKFVFKDGGKQCAEVVAAVMTKANGIYDDTIPSSDKKAFDRRFVLLEKGNYEAQMKVAMQK